ncbi:MAG: methyltransferase domain-containing protein [Gemmatimonadota bacterium]
MPSHSATHTGHSHRSVHLLLGLLIVAGGAVFAFWPAARSALLVVGAASVAIHLGLAVVALLGARMVMRAHSGRHSSALPGSIIRPTGTGQIIRWAFLYDAVVAALTFGRAGALRASVLDLIRLSPGEQVLDVGCGTGELALAAKRRVGAKGSVRGVDAGAEMVARAREKAVRAGFDVPFDVAPAQALPFPDASFDVALCALMMHHLPQDGRRQAVAEMHRVLKPGGRLLVADLAHEHGLLASLDPVALVHGRAAMHAADEAEALMRDARFSGIVAGRTALRAVGYSLGWKDE